MLTAKKYSLSICSAHEEMIIEILERETLKWGETKFSKMGYVQKWGKPKFCRKTEGGHYESRLRKGIKN